MTGTRLTIVGALMLYACQSQHPTTSSSARSAPAAASCKPEAPVAVELTTRPVDGGELEVSMRAIPTSHVDALDLALVLPPHAIVIGKIQARFGATAAGTARSLTTRIRVDDRTSLVTAIGRVPVDGVEMSRTATAAIGRPAPPPRTAVYALPDGERVREVRP
jgi:hypothetical protein